MSFFRACVFFSLPTCLVYSNRLSAHIFKITSDTRYVSAADAAVGFVFAHMHEDGAIVDTIRLSSEGGSVANCTNRNFTLYSYITGYTIWGLAVLGTYTTTYEAQ